MVSGIGFRGLGFSGELREEYCCSPALVRVPAIGGLGCLEMPWVEVGITSCQLV